jgi:Fic family protein
MSKYIHLSEDWPTFNWEDDKIILQLSNVRHKQGRLLGKMEGIGFRLREEAH